MNLTVDDSITFEFAQLLDEDLLRHAVQLATQFREPSRFDAERPQDQRLPLAAYHVDGGIQSAKKCLTSSHGPLLPPIQALTGR